jgi:hypothetical protein
VLLQLATVKKKIDMASGDDEGMTQKHPNPQHQQKKTQNQQQQGLTTLPGKIPGSDRQTLTEEF